MAVSEKRRAVTVLSALRSKKHLKFVPSAGGMMEALLLSLIAQGSSLAAARRALDRIRLSVVNWNELRVTQVKDVAGWLSGTRDAQQKAVAIHDVLSSIFEQTHDLEFVFLEGASTAEAKDFLSVLGALTEENIDEFVLAGRGHFNIAADGDVVRVLKRLGLNVRAESPPKCQAALEESVGADRAYQLLYLAKLLSESTCNPHGAKCPECPVEQICPSARKSRSK